MAVVDVESFLALGRSSRTLANSASSVLRGEQRVVLFKGQVVLSQQVAALSPKVPLVRVLLSVVPMRFRIKVVASTLTVVDAVLAVATTPLREGLYWLKGLTFGASSHGVHYEM